MGSPRIGFDNEKYLREQEAEILKRVQRFGNRLYLEFGGKLIFDYHAARVLPWPSCAAARRTSPTSPPRGTRPACASSAST